MRLFILSLVAIAGVVAVGIELVANHVDGVAASACFTVVGVIVGYYVRSVKKT